MKCGKEIAEDSRFCTSCGCAINPSSVAPTSRSSTVTAPKRNIRTSWIDIGGDTVVLRIAIPAGRKSPENKPARNHKTKASEKPVSWDDVKKSWAEARKAKQDLDKSVNELKSEWNGLKRQVKDAVNGVEAQGGSSTVDQEAFAKEFKSGVQKSSAVIKSTLNNKDLQNAANELKAALED